MVPGNSLRQTIATYSQDLASFSRVTAVEDEDGPRDDSSLHTANIVIIGDKTVGKTSIARVRRD